MIIVYIGNISGGDELMKKVKLIIASVAMLSLVSSSAVYGDGFAPGEGLYVGAFAGLGTGLVQPTVSTRGGATNTVSGGVGTNADGTMDRYSGQVNDGGIGLQGVEGGGMVGYGYKMGDLYAGLEGEMSAGDVTFRVSGDDIELGDQVPGTTGDTTISAIEATKEWTGGMFGRIGYYINADTLLSLRGGALVSKFEVTVSGSTNYTEDFYGGGPSVGASLESRISAIDPNLSLRMDAVFTDYLTANVYGIGGNDPTNAANRSGHDSEVTGSAMSTRIGLQYSFFDVNSLF